MILRFIFLAVFVCVAFGVKEPQKASKAGSKILMLLPFTTPSHRNCFNALALGLVEKGYEVTIVTAQPMVKHPKIIEVNHGIPLGNTNMDMVEMLEMAGGSGTGGWTYFYGYILTLVAKEVYKFPSVMAVYNKRSQFDLIIVDSLFNELAYPFVQGLPFIFLSPPGRLEAPSAAQGNVLNPSFVSAAWYVNTPPFSFLQRFRNVWESASFNFDWRYWTVIPSVENELRQKFPDFAGVTAIEKNASLTLLNSHFAINGPIPLLPSQVEIGAIHCRPAKPLPEDLANFIDGSPEGAGVIYFSLGSIIRGSTLPEEYKRAFVETFGKLKSRVIWKFEEEIEGLPENVILRKWLPQQDILGHPKVKLFISHGGLFGMQESVYHETPILSLPMFADQMKNGRLVEDKKFGRILKWEDLNVKTLQTNIEEILTNPVYQQKVSSVSRILRDQPLSPLDKAMWWVEYIIRHKGEKYLECDGKTLSWLGYFYVDWIICVHVTVFVLYSTIKALVNLLKTKKKPKSGSQSRAAGKSKKE